MTAMNRYVNPLLRALGLLALAGTLSASAATVSLSFNNPPSGTVANGTLVPVNVVAATDGAPVMVSVTLNFRTWAPLCTNLWNTLVMVSPTADTNYVATIPRLPASNVDFYASCVYMDESSVVYTNQTATNTYTVGATLDGFRSQTFEGSWTSSGSPNWNIYDPTTTWTGTQVRVLASSIRGTPPGPLNSSAWCLRFQNVSNAYVMSPMITGGVGKVYFQAGNQSGSDTNTFVLQASTNGGSLWTTIQTNTFVGTNAFNIVANVNTNVPCLVRIFRPGLGGGNGFVEFDNIVIAPPPADLQVSQPTNAVLPVYPQAPDAVTFTCNVQDLSTNEPTINQRVTLLYNFVATNGTATGWTSASLTNVPGSTQFTTTLAALGAGTNKYYYRCDFDGYYYTNSDKRGPYYLSNAGQTSTNVVPTNTAYRYVVNFQNTRIIRLQALPDFDFGLCATNDLRTRTLQICNDGNVPMTVTNIVLDNPDFTTTFTTNLTVLPNGTQSVVVTFSPHSEGPYTNVLWVQSDMTSGTDSNQVTGTGMPLESVSQPSVTGASVGTLYQSLGFSVSVAATDNWGYAVQNDFFWGDGSSSGWSTNASATHAWSNAGTFSVTVQGRSLINPSVLSLTSTPISVTITNTRILGLSGNLNFGIVGVNAATTNTALLTLTNSGNGPLTVSTITSSDSSFTVSPTNFVIPAFGASNVTVSFGPTTVNTFTSTLTVVSDMTSGSNTTLATGSSEQLTMLSLTPPSSAGTVAQLFTFTAVGTNSSSDPLNYIFNWGDGSGSSSSSGSATHSWTNAGSYSVQVVAQCQTHPNAYSAWYGPVAVTITNNRILGFSGNLNFSIVVTNFTSNLTVTVTNTGNASVTVTGITFATSFFTAAPTSFVLLTNRSTNVIVTFSPIAPGSYTDTMVVASDATSTFGNSSRLASGFGEMISQTTISPTNAAGTLSPSTVSFSAYATNNIGEAIDYRFDWGDTTISGWSASTNVAHAWTNIGNYNVRAQARCHINTNNISPWSSNATLSITNTRVMVLSPASINFGGVMTNQSATSTLVVSNSGNAAFVVTDITWPSGFSATPTSFSVPANGSSNVTVTFQPSGLGGFGGTLAVNSTNAAGQGILVTGFCEVVYAPILTNSALGGHVNDTISFSAIASNNSGHPIQYRYDWGDGSTSAWTSAAATTHVWTATNAYVVLIQASCQQDTNVISAWSTTNLVNIYAAPFFTFSTLTNGLPFGVTMTATGAVPATASNCVFYFIPPGSTNAQPTNLTFVSGFNWTTTVPPLDAGNLAYYLQYMRQGVTLRYPAVSNNTLVLSNGLSGTRQDGFESGWSTASTPVWSAWNSSGWTGTQVRLLSGTIRTPGLNSSGFVLRMQNTNNAYIASPLLPQGIGTIYFDAGAQYTNNSSYPPNTFYVQVSTDSGSTWSNVFNYTFTPPYVFPGAADIHPAIQLNLRVPAMVRWFQPNAVAGSQYLLFDNLTISPPPTDVRLTESLHNPGYPNQKDPTLVRCQVADADPVNAPTSNRRLKVYYAEQLQGLSQPATPYTNSSSMYAIGNSLYEGVIPVSPMGTMWYYFKCDFDGYYYSNNVITNATFASEQISPAYLPDQRIPTTVGPFQVYAQYPAPIVPPYLSTLPVLPSYTINFFRSDVAGITLQTTPYVGAPQNTMQLVDDYVWQGQILMANITNLNWFFVGSSVYSNDAASYGATISWGDTNQDFIYPPLGGTAEVTTNRSIQASLVYNGFLVFRFTTTNQNYLARRAVYQDFDNPPWPADPNYFEASLGLYAISTFTNNFATWGTNYYPANRWSIENFQNEALNQPVSSSTRVTYNWWAYREAQPIADRAYQAPLYSVVQNVALLLTNNANAQGQVWNTSGGGVLPEGIHNFTFRARLAQSDGRYALYQNDLLNLTNGSPWTSGYRVTSTMRALSMSPGTPSVSLILGYSRNSYLVDSPNPDLGHFYEVRLSQGSAVSAADNLVQMQLWRWNNGVASPITSAINFTNTAKLTDPTPLLIDISWTNISNTLQFTGAVTRAGVGMCLIGGVDYTPIPVPNVSPAQYGGLVGALCVDAEAEVRDLNVYTGTNLTLGAQIPMVGWNSADSTPNSWYFGGTRLDGQRWWQTNVSGSVGYLTRPVPAAPARLALSEYRTGISGPLVPDLSIYTNVAAFSVRSFTNVGMALMFTNWDKTYVMLQYTNGDLPIVVDDLTLDPWRAYTRGAADSNWNSQASVAGVQFWNWTSTAQQASWAQSGTPDLNGWLITEGWVSSILGNNYVAFERSRANPALDQGVWSPIMTNGFGSIAFQVQVTAGTSVYRIDSTATNDPTQWTPKQIFTNTVADGLVNQVVAIQVPNMTGRIRILQLPTTYSSSNTWNGGSSPDAVLTIANLVALDYPPPDITTWSAYNCLITSALANTNTARKAYQGQTCYLNNSPTAGVLPPYQLLADNPYVQTPQVDTGVGEISFWYRAWDTNTAHVSIQVAPNADVPIGQWTVLTNFAVTNLSYQFFDYIPFDLTDKVMRIYTQTNSLSNVVGRLCIDNILMSEPVRASYEITSVTLLPSQPLMTDQVGVQATIGRFLMDPKGKRVFLSYVVGTNQWGKANWWGTGLTPKTNVVTVELTNTVGQTYATTSSTLIPVNPIDSVVQYVVWGTNDNMVGTPYFQGSNSFVNPSWYTPVDLNSNYAAQGWSPYYFVYSCPPGSVWVNEINPAFNTVQRTNEYIELVGPANANIGGWSIELRNSSRIVTTNCAITNNFVLTNTVNGWGFFVLGDTAVPRVNLRFNPPLNANIPDPGGVRLIRSMGAVEDMVCWDVLSLTNFGYRFAGNQLRAAPLMLIDVVVGGGSNKNDFTWFNPTTGNYTPGLANVNQALTNAPVVLSGLTYTLSVVVGLNGTATLLTAVPLASGTSTTIVYTANDWCRIQALTSNTTPVSAAVNMKVYTQQISSIFADISNTVAFYQPPSGVVVPTNVPPVWLASWGQTESTPFYNNGSFVLQQEYLLGVNPYIAETYSFNVTALAVTNTTVSVAVNLKTNGANYTLSLTNGTLYLDGFTNLVASGLQVGSTNLLPGGSTTFRFTDPGSNKFYRARIQ